MSTKQFSSLDAIDLRLLSLLQEDGRSGYQELGDAIGLSGPSAYQRVRKLEGAGVIVGYHARIDPSRLGRGLVAFLRVRPASGDVGRLAKQWAAAGDILECHRVSTDGGFLLKLRVRDVSALLPHAEAIQKSGCAVQVDIVLSTEFERWTLSAPEAARQLDHR